jgi:hypothetical protein
MGDGEIGAAERGWFSAVRPVAAVLGIKLLKEHRNPCGHLSTLVFIIVKKSGSYIQNEVEFLLGT